MRLVNDTQSRQSLCVSFAEELLSEIKLSIIKSRNLSGLEWMEGIQDETFDWSDAFETKKGVAFIDLPWTLDNVNRA